LPEQFRTGFIGFPFIELQSIDSTNNYAFGLIHAGLAQHGQAIFAHEQTGGKGQRGKQWLSEKSSNLILSIVIRPYFIPLDQQFRLAVISALAIHEFFKNYTGNDTRIKWPNDLYWQDRKAGGILIESLVGATDNKNPDPPGNGWKWAVIGAGININQVSFPPAITNAVSLRQITGKSYDPVFLAKELCTIMDKYYDGLARDGFDIYNEMYNSVLYKKDDVVKLKTGNRVFEAVITGVTSSGKLQVRHRTAEEFDFGQVEWLL
jgi:BirA family transcriptional regulator, biotin operon repressor / biotin---[acetyl-CoA-carboxylase] ligase